MTFHSVLCRVLLSSDSDVDNHVFFLSIHGYPKKRTREERPPRVSLLSIPLSIIVLSSLSPTPVIVLYLGVMSILGEERWIISERQRKIHRINWVRRPAKAIKAEAREQVVTPL